MNNFIETYLILNKKTLSDCCISQRFMAVVRGLKMYVTCKPDFVLRVTGTTYKIPGKSRLILFFC